MPLVDRAVMDAISHIHVYSQPLVGSAKGDEQLVLNIVHQGVMYICQKLCLGHKGWDINPLHRHCACQREKELQFIDGCPIYLPQLLN